MTAGGAKAKASPRKRAFQVFCLTVLVFGVAALVVGYRFWTYPDTPGGSAQGEVALVIPKGASARTVGNLLAEAKLLDNPTMFRLYAGQRGVASRFKAGRYTLSGPVTPRALIEQLVKGAAEELVTVTIPEGKNMVEVVDLLAAAQIAEREALLATVLDPAFANELALPGQTLEGYLFPDTYKLRPGTAPERVLLSLVRRHREVFEQLRAQYGASLDKLQAGLGWDDHHVVIMASIVEKETGRPEERPRIAQVFINRLTLDAFQPKLLQTDPTIVYGCVVAPLFMGPASKACAELQDRIRTIHLRDLDNPYSTYAHPGLPPGPIANPGLAALAAVMNPDGTRFLYFVARNDGSHAFSATRAEHDAAVVKYQRGGKPLASQD